MTRWWTPATLAACLWFETPAAAQVNTEPLRDKIHQQGASFLLQATLDGHTGNTTGVTADALMGGGFASGRHLAFAFASFDYSKLNESLGVDKSFAHLRYNYEMTPWLWGEAFAQAQSDLFQRIAERDLSGVGLRFAMYQEPQVSLFCGIAYMFEHDVTSAAPGETGETGEWQPVTNRVSSYLTEHTKLKDNIVTVATIYVQPEIVNPSNVRASVDVGFIFVVSKWLSTNIAFSGHYDSDPPPGVLPTDTELKNAIAVTW